MWPGRGAMAVLTGALGLVAPCPAAIAEARAELERALGLLAQRRITLQTLQTEVMGRLPELRRMAEVAYREGQGGILELLDAFRTLKEAQLGYLDQVLLVKTAEVDTLAAAGLVE